MSEPTAIDYKLLGYIGNSVSVSRAQIDKRFKKYSPSIDARIRFLTYDMCYIAEDTTQWIGDTGDITVTHLGVYRITELGVRTLQDYRRQKNETIRRIWLPVLISNAIAFTALVISIIALLK